MTLVILTTLLLFNCVNSNEISNGSKVKSLYEKGLEIIKQLAMLAESGYYIKSLEEQLIK